MCLIFFFSNIARLLGTMSLTFLSGSLRTLHSAYNGHSVSMHLCVKCDPTLFTLLGNNPKACTWSRGVGGTINRASDKVLCCISTKKLIFDLWNPHKIQARWLIFTGMGCGAGKRGRQISGVWWSTSLDESVSSKVSGRLCLKK